MKRSAQGVDVSHETSGEKSADSSRSTTSETCHCRWCSKEFRRGRAVGGHAKEYCSDFCRNGHNKARRAYAVHLEETGALTVEGLKTWYAQQRSS